MAALEPDRFELTHNLGLALVASSIAPLLLMKADRTDPGHQHIVPDHLPDRSGQRRGPAD
jgi:hypothetical protein